MFRPMTSGVSALSGFVANGHQAMHCVSSSPSKIPYGGFSPVRLQTGLQPPPSHASLQRGLIGGQSPAGPHRHGPAWGKRRTVSASFGGSRDCPVQRPLARRRVMLSRRVDAYYGLIRGPGPLPPPYGFGGGSLPCGRARPRSGQRPRERQSFQSLRACRGGQGPLGLRCRKG